MSKNLLTRAMWNADYLCISAQLHTVSDLNSLAVWASVLQAKHQDFVFCELIFSIRLTDLTGVL